MSRQMTYSEACVRFAALVTTDISIEEAVQQAVDRIFEQGRYPGTTEEVELVEANFIESADAEEWYYFFSEADYDGAIGFRNSSRGWAIVDQVSLYRDGINSGDREWVDMGTITEDGVDLRKYRAPLGFVPSSGPYYALLKKEAPTLAGDDIIPVQSVGALSCAIRAVCYEYVSDEARSNANWAKFNEFITLSSRQTAGPKKYNLGVNHSLKRRPSQFY